MMVGMKHLSLTIAVMTAVLACDSQPDPKTIRALTLELAEACPLAANSDESARNRCADRLARSELLARTMGATVLWGGHNQNQGGTYVPENRPMTVFDSFVFRRLYLSMLMFSGNSTTEEREGLTLVRMPVVFRNQMSEGSYPYPFWHSADKWDAYQVMTEMIFVFRGSEIVALYRSGKDESRRTQMRGPFDGQWRWFDEAGEEQPHVALFSYLLSPENTHLFELDTAYRAFESEARQNMCEVCHAPDNVSQMNPLVILNMPNQALSFRRDLLEVLEQNSMPPEIGLDSETRSALIDLAQEFARVGDLALEFESDYSTQ